MISPLTCVDRIESLTQLGGDEMALLATHAIRFGGAASVRPIVSPQLHTTPGIDVYAGLVPLLDDGRYRSV